MTVLRIGPNLRRTNENRVYDKVRRFSPLKVLENFRKIYKKMASERLKMRFSIRFAVRNVGEILDEKFFLNCMDLSYRRPF